MRLSTKTSENQWKILAMQKRLLRTTRQKDKYISWLQRSQREKRETNHVRIMIERISKVQRRKFKKLILNYNYKISRNICLLKKKMMNVAKEWRKEVINDYEREHWSEEKSYLFVSESCYTLLASVNTYEMKTKQHDDDKKWWEREKQESLLNC